MDVQIHKTRVISDSSFVNKYGVNTRFTCVCACPLTQPKKVESKEIEFNPDFIRRMLKRVQWGAIKEAADIVRLIQQSH